MDLSHLEKLMTPAKMPKITVFGDYCLDQYYYIDPLLDEPSIETDLIAYQVTHTKSYAGAAGTITNNLRALGADVACVGILGEDGNGHELSVRLRGIGADTSLMVRTGSRQTCSYIKPMRKSPEGWRELNRLDIRNFTETPRDVEDALIANLEKASVESDAVIICDQFTELNLSAVTDRVREAIADLALKQKDRIWYADSRGHIGKFRNVIIKCNHKEIAAIFGEDPETVDPRRAAELARRLYLNNLRPVAVTLGERGCVVYDGQVHFVPAFSVSGPLDICGAGDAFNAGIVFALTLGADLANAAAVGNACSSSVIKQIGVTGTATVADVLAAFKNQKT